MAFYFQKTYRPDIEQLLRQYAQSLSAKDRRRFAALEAITLGHGGTRSIAKVLGCDPQTVKDGMRELTQLPDDPAGSRVRKPGGGRKKTEVKHADLPHQVQETIKNRTAGDPMRPHVVWTDLTPQEIAKSLQDQSVCAPPRIVRRMLDGLGVARRQRAKGLPGGDSPHRGAQFRHLAQVIQAFLEAGNPVLRIDTTKKECVGTLYRDGKVYCHQALTACDPDFPSLASGLIMPHGIDDLAAIRAGCMWGSAGTRPSLPARACGCFGTRMVSVCPQKPQRSCSCAMAEAVTVVTSICARKTSKAWSMTLQYRSAWRITRRMARNATRSSAACSATSPELVRACCVIPSIRCWDGCKRPRHSKDSPSQCVSWTHSIKAAGR